MNNRERLKILIKLAQTAIPAASPATPATNTSVSGAPLSFTATDYYPSIIQGFQARNVPLINRLVAVLNNALFYDSNGQVQMNWMRNNNFNFALDQVSSIDLKNIMGFCKLVYLQILTNLGQNYQKPLTGKEIFDKINILKGSLFLTNLSQVSPTSQLAAKIGGNLKTILTDILTNIR